jgi:UDP:flavonoid glycosyltransferase YjiC (YdhE family)
MVALAHGVPLVCVPMGRDQFHNSQRVEEVGAGITVPMDAPVSDIREAVANVLSDDSYRAGAARIAGVIAGYGNGTAAVTELEALL